MATYLADTNLLLRIADPASPQHPIATQALARLFRQADEVFLTPQNFIEFWVVATRPIAANGFGWNSGRTVREMAQLQERFPLLPDAPEVFTVLDGPRKATACPRQTRSRRTTGGRSAGTQGRTLDHLQRCRLRRIQFHHFID